MVNKKLMKQINECMNLLNANERKKIKKSGVILWMLIFFRTIVYAQTPVEINLAKIDYKQIESAFYVKINKLREEKGCGKLAPDNILKQAADDQSAYMQSTHVVGHTQKVKGKENPQNRVQFYKGTHEMIGENCIEILLKVKMKTKYAPAPIIVSTYEQAAEALFLGWKNSPVHYKNMIEPKYDVAGLGFFFSADSSALYCAQVFGTKPFVQVKGLESPADAYGILLTNKKTCDCFNTPAFTQIQSTMQFMQLGDSVYLRCEDYPALKNFFNKPLDGIYLDVVLRDQFVCTGNNQLHGSTIYDGMMLKPVYFVDLYKRNKAIGAKNFFAFVCAIPKKVGTYKYGVNSGFIKDNVSCSYRWGNIVPGENLKALSLYPKWIKLPNENIPADSFKGELSFSIPFERGKTALTEEQQIKLTSRLQIYKPFLKEVNIKTFSSVEGATELNLKLQEQRAEALKATIQKVTGQLSNVQTESKENWDDFYEQIKNTSFSHLKALSKEAVKDFLKSKAILDSIDYLLSKTRIARVTVQLEAYIDNNSNPYLIVGAYKKAVEAGDSLRSFRYQNRLVQSVLRHELANGDVTQVNLPFKKKFLAHWTNYIALATFDPELLYSYEVRDRAINAMNMDTTFAPLQFNMCITTLKFINDYMDTLMPVSTLERRMKSVSSLLTKSPEDVILVKKMMLNYHIISAYQYWLQHSYDKINEHLDFIKQYYDVQLVSEAEVVKLAMMFNFYGRYAWTNEILAPFVKKGSSNEDLVFLFIKTNTSIQSPMFSGQEWLDVLHKARTMNVKRFYKWVDEENFQLLRLDEIKKEFCTIDKKELK
jgi:uncharacterized protein YkwD